MSGRYLIDTNVFLWWLGDHTQLSERVKSLMADPENTLCLSVASAWEMTIKIALGKLKPLSIKLEPLLVQERIELLPIRLAHIDKLGQLPFHHRDPFDRMLIAQAYIEGLDLVTGDSQLKAYDVPIIEAA